MSDDPRFTGYWAAIRADLNKQTVDAVIRLADNEQADLRATIERVRALPSVWTADVGFAIPEHELREALGGTK